MEGWQMEKKIQPMKRLRVQGFYEVSTWAKMKKKNQSNMENKSCEPMYGFGYKVPMFLPISWAAKFPMSSLNQQTLKNILLMEEIRRTTCGI